MDDWENPGTSAVRAQAGSGPDEKTKSLEQQLANALDRIEALERRVKQLEDRA